MANVFDKIVGTPHVVAESSMLHATEAGHIASLKCHEDLDNGSIVCMGNFVEEQVFASKAYVAGERPYIVLTPPMGYNSDRRIYQDEQYFYNAKDEIARAYQLEMHDIFTVSEVAFAVAPVVGQFVDADYAVSDAAPEAGFCGEVIEVVNYTNYKSYRILVRSLGV